MTAAVHIDNGIQDGGINFGTPNYAANTARIGAKGTCYFTKTIQETDQNNVAHDVVVPDREIYGVSGFWHWAYTTDRTGTKGYSVTDTGSDSVYTGDNNGWNYTTNVGKSEAWLPGGNSCAAAQVSALAGLLYAKKARVTDRVTVANHIKNTASSTYTRDATHGIEFRPNDWTTNGHKLAYIPGVVDFGTAVTTF